VILQLASISCHNQAHATGISKTRDSEPTAALLLLLAAQHPLDGVATVHAASAELCLVESYPYLSAANIAVLNVAAAALSPCVRGAAPAACNMEWGPPTRIEVLIHIHSLLAHRQVLRMWLVLLPHSCQPPGPLGTTTRPCTCKVQTV
jgi:hypothetical protein